LTLIRYLFRISSVLKDNYLGIIGSFFYIPGIVFVFHIVDIDFPFPVETGLSFGLELNLVVNLVLLLMGIAVFIYEIEKRYLDKDYNRGLLLMALLGPAGFFLINRYFPVGNLPDVIRKDDRPRDDQGNITAFAVFSVVVVLVVSVSFVFILNKSGSMTWNLASAMKNRELKAYERLIQIADAQDLFREKDMDGNGKQDYCAFYIHLWTMIGPDAEPVRLNLIPKRLAFAMRRPYALDGYFYVDIHYRGPRLYGEIDDNTLIDHDNAFALGAFPADNMADGLLCFIIDQDRHIYAGELEYIEADSNIGLYAYPYRPTAVGWKEIKDIEGLIGMQQVLDYRQSKGNR